MISLGIAVAIRVLEIVPHTLFSSISRIHARFGVNAYLFCIGSHNYCIMTPPHSPVASCPHVLDSSFSILVRKRRSHGLDGQAMAHDAFWIFFWCFSTLVNRGSLDCVLHLENFSFFWFRPGLDL